jgi:cell wall-associated protease
MDEGAIMITLKILILFVLSFELFANEPLFHRQWALRNQGQTILLESGELTRERVAGIPGMDIDWVDEAELNAIIRDQQLTVSEKPVVVAVIDSGIDLNHPEFQNRLWFNHKLCDDLSSEEKDRSPCHGWNFLDGNNDLTDDVGHGTHVAGLIAANKDGRGIQGAAPSAIKIMPLKVINKDVNGFVYKNQVITNIIADAIGFAAQNEAQIINLSLGWPEIINTPKIQFAIKRAQDLGILIVAATGNNNKNIPTYPCATSGVLCVGAMDNRGILTEFSNYSGKVDLVAPGEDIVSLLPFNLESRIMRIQGLEVKRGSSQASPYVAAVAATLKYLYPNMSLEELKSRLQQSSVRLADQPKTIKYGRLSMRGAIEYQGSIFVEPDYKGLLEILVDKNQRFSIEIPIINHLETIRNVQAQLSVNHDEIHLDQQVFELGRLGSGVRRVIRLTGHLSKMSIDAEHQLCLKLSNEEDLHSSCTLLVFSRRFDPKEHSPSVGSDINPDHVSFFNGPQRISRLRRIKNYKQEELSFEWFFQNPTLQTAHQSSISILRSNLENTQALDLILPDKVQQVLSVFKIDLNFDGKLNYIVYSIDASRRNLIFDVFDHKGTLLDSSYKRFTLPISTFEGLPLRGDIEDFVWVRHNLNSTDKIVIPSFKRIWTLPEEDNTRDLLDRLSPDQAERLYYLKPELNTEGSFEFKIRTFESLAFQRDLEQRLNSGPFDSMTISKPFDQTDQERLSGQFKVLLFSGIEARKRVFMVTFQSTQSYTLEELHLGVHAIEGNHLQRLLDLQQNQVSSTIAAMALVSREHARILTQNRELQESSRLEIKNPSYGDPFFSFLGASQSHGEQVYFLETRYSIKAYSNQTGVHELPINRESSFPGLNFSEMFAFSSIKSTGDQSNFSGLTVNATQVFGNRLYSMVYKDGEFLRPIDLSWSLPNNCLPLTLNSTNKATYMTFLCRNESRQLELFHLPLESGL